MGKEKLIRVTKILYVFIFLVILVTLFFLHFLSGTTSLIEPLSSLTFWLIFIGWVFLALIKAVGVARTMLFSLTIFLLSAGFVIVGLSGVGEVLMRVSFIGWLIGIGQALIAARKAQ